jgi:small subunit ribosomal protein S2
MSESLPTIKELFKVGAHYGHRKNRTDARARSYVFTYRNRVSVINLEKTRESLEKALDFIAEKAKGGATILFAGTKLQAKESIKLTAEKIGAPYVIERWPGGLISNFDVVIKSIRKMNKTEEDLAENKLDHLKKKEILKIQKDLTKSKKIFGGLSKMEKIPDIIILVDAKHETNALNEAIGSSIPTIGISDVNSNPRLLTYPIVANDDSRETIELILNLIAQTYKANFKEAVKDENSVEERIMTKTELEMEKRADMRNRRGGNSGGNRGRR